jgi:AcrR family transcriptional regulator
MDNASRSERTRKAALEAALAIIARDGPGKLTLDAIAKEAGISKGGLMHQFPSKHAVLKALLERQVEYFEAFGARYAEKAKAESDQPELASAIATLREAALQPNSFAIAILGALAEEPSLMSISRDRDTDHMARIKAEARDPELALLRRAAAQGLVLGKIFGLATFTREEQTRLFDRLLDDARWAAV